MLRSRYARLHNAASTHAIAGNGSLLLLKSSSAGDLLALAEPFSIGISACCMARVTHVGNLVLVESIPTASSIDTLPDGALVSLGQLSKVALCGDGYVRKKGPRLGDVAMLAPRTALAPTYSKILQILVSLGTVSSNGRVGAVAFPADAFAHALEPLARILRGRLTASVPERAGRDAGRLFTPRHALISRHGRRDGVGRWVEAEACRLAAVGVAFQVLASVF